MTQAEIGRYWDRFFAAAEGGDDALIQLATELRERYPGDRDARAIGTSIAMAIDSGRQAGAQQEPPATP